MIDQSQLHDLIGKFHAGEITDEDFCKLETALKESPDARRQFHLASRVDSRLKRLAEELDTDTEEQESKIVSPRHFARRVSLLNSGLAAAIVVLLGSIGWMWFSQPEVIAEIKLSENAAWESPLPTSPGSMLTAGPMKLTAGIATLRFQSGATMTLEAPAQIQLNTAMHARLETGAAVLEVPESAQGFILDTPDGRIIDHGTSFAVNIRPGDSTVEVIEGEISVHHSTSGKQARLIDNQAASLTSEALAIYDTPLPLPEVTDSELIRVGTAGHSASVIRANKKKWMHPDKLMVKRRMEPHNHERRSFFSFDLSEFDLEKVESARLRLNQVPSGLGFAARLKPVNEIAVYGITNTANVNWPDTEVKWEDGPTQEDGELLGSIQISRSQQRGSRFFSSDKLLSFLREQQLQGSKQVTFLLDGSIDPVTGEHVPSLVIAFASDTNPEAPGPMLEFVMRK